MRLGKRRESFFAVADIGSGSGGVCILATNGTTPAHIIAAQRCTLSFEERSEDATIAGIIGMLAEASQKAIALAQKNTSVGALSGVYAVVRGPWTRSKTIRATTEIPEHTHVDGAMISKIAKDALAHDTQFDSANIMEAIVMRVELNGYATARPEGKHAETIAVSVLVSDVDPRLRTGILETLTRIFSVQPILRSGLRALLSTMRESSVLPKECVLVDITSEATHVVAIRKGVPAETAVVGEGKRSILKRLAGDKMPEEVLGLMRLLEEDTCESAACQALQASIAQVEPELVRVFGEAMSTLAARRRLPNPLIIAAHENLLPWLTRFFSRIDFSQFTVTTRPFVARAIDPEHLADIIDVPRDVSDRGLLIAASLVNIETRA